MPHNLNRQTLLMQWFNFMGTILAICNLILMFFGFQLIIVSFVNDFNSDIKSDVNYHFHYGVSFAGLVLVLSSVIGFAGFLKESLPNLCLSWALMIFVLLLLCQSVTFMWYYKPDLSLLIHSEAETSFIHFFNENNFTSTSKYKRKIEITMKKYQCCGWDSKDPMVHNRSPILQDVYPCECCSKNIDFVDECNLYYNNPNNPKKSVCNGNATNLVNRVCIATMKEVFEKDLTDMRVFMVIVILLTVVSIFLSVRLSTSLLDIYNASD